MESKDLSQLVLQSTSNEDLIAELTRRLGGVPSVVAEKPRKKRRYLSEHQKRQAQALLRQGVRYAEIAAQFDVSDGCIGNLARVTRGARRRISKAERSGPIFSQLKPLDV